MLDLASSPGGLRLGLPKLNTKTTTTTAATTTTTAATTAATATTATTATTTTATTTTVTDTPQRLRSIDVKRALAQVLEIKNRPPGWQYQNQLSEMMKSPKYTDLLPSSKNISRPSDSREQPKAFTIADAINRVKIADKDLQASTSVTRALVAATVDIEDGPTANELRLGVFESNERLRQMAENMPTISGTVPYTIDEIRRSLREGTHTDNL